MKKEKKKKTILNYKGTKLCVKMCTLIWSRFENRAQSIRPK